MVLVYTITDTSRTHNSKLTCELIGVALVRTELTTRVGGLSGSVYKSVYT